MRRLAGGGKIGRTYVVHLNYLCRGGQHKRLLRDRCPSLALYGMYCTYLGAGRLRAEGEQSQ